MTNSTETEEESAAPPRARRRGAVKLLVVVLGTVLAASAYGYWRYAAVRASTDDAAIDGHLHAVSARVGGAVLKVNVDDNQYVKAGTVLVEIDPTDYRIAVERARADLADAEAILRLSRTAVPITSATTASRLSETQAGVSDADAGLIAARKQVDAARARWNATQSRIEAMQANDEKAARDLERMKTLVAKDEISRQQYDAAVAAAKAQHADVQSARAQAEEAAQDVRVAEGQVQQQQARVRQARARVEAARTAPQQVAATRAQASASDAKVAQAKANLEQAEVNLQYATIRAPVNGIVSRRTVESGQVVQPGQALLAVVPLDDIWVTANFKENELGDMRPGQRATVTVDAYGGRTFKGHVDSIAAATGARFSLLPPENATGNFVKVVQRVPVKIVLDKGQDPEHLLRPGMSVVPTVFTR